MAAMQDELGPECVTGVVSVTVTDGNSDVQFEAFQVCPCLVPSLFPAVSLLVSAVQQCLKGLKARRDHPVLHPGSTSRPAGVFNSIKSCLPCQKVVTKLDRGECRRRCAVLCDIYMDIASLYDGDIHIGRRCQHAEFVDSHMGAPTRLCMQSKIWP